MDIYTDELQKIMSFTEKNRELVESTLNIAAVNIMKILNEFNLFEGKLTTLITNYYKISYSPNLDFRTDVLDSGYLSYGQKLKILEIILEKCNYPYGNNVNSKKYLGPLKIIGDLRNDIVHSVYGLNPEKASETPPEIIICTNGRKIGKNDLLKVFSSFEKHLSKSNATLTHIAEYLYGRNIKCLEN